MHIMSKGYVQFELKSILVSYNMVVRTGVRYVARLCLEALNVMFELV